MIATLIPRRRRSNAARFVAVFGLGLASLTACGGSRADEVAVSHSPLTTESTPQQDGRSTAAAVAGFGQVLADSPAWAAVRRVAPPEVVALQGNSTSWLIGTLDGVEVGPVESAPLGAFPDAPVVEWGYVDLMFTVASVPTGVALKPGDVVRIPFLVWRAGPGGPRDEAIDQVVSRLRETVPVGLSAVLYLSSAPEPAERGVSKARLPTVGFAPEPAAVTFETPDRGLVSLDWLVGDSAETYLGATTDSEVLAEVG